MEKGVSFNTSFLLDYIKEEEKEIEKYIEERLNESYYEFTNDDDMHQKLLGYFLDFLAKLNISEQEDLQSYTNYYFRNINAVLRNNWNYDVNGLLTEEKSAYYRELADRITKIIWKSSSIPFNLKVYRGVSIQAFYSYNIYSLDELVHLKGRYILDSGFTSTSLIKAKCFYNKDVYTLTGKPNILIEYLIPKGSDDGVGLVSEQITYSKSLDEFLINSFSLFKVVDVEIDKANNTAFIRALLIPEKIWNYKDYSHNRREINTLKK